MTCPADLRWTQSKLPKQSVFSLSVLPKLFFLSLCCALCHSSLSLSLFCSLSVPLWFFLSRPELNHFQTVQFCSRVRCAREARPIGFGWLSGHTSLRAGGGEK